jgi:hypothetical protein
MKSIRVFGPCCVLLLALGAVAMQNPSNPPAPSGQAAPPPSTQPAPSGQQQPPSNPPSSPQEQPPQGTTRTMQPPTIDDQVKALGVELNLTPDQQAKTKTILEDQRTQAMTIVNDSSMQREDKIQKLRTLREGTISKVRALLSDDQKKKLDQMLSEDESPARKDQQPSPSPK